MELKTARLTLLIDPNKKLAFERLCAQQDRTASQVVRQLIREYMAAHGAQFVASGTVPAPAGERENGAGPVPRAPSRRPATRQPKAANPSAAGGRKA